MNEVGFENSPFCGQYSMLTKGQYFKQILWDLQCAYGHLCAFSMLFNVQNPKLHGVAMCDKAQTSHGDNPASG